MKRIVWSTDIHLNFVEPAALDEYIGRLVDASPDIVLISGDIADSRSVVDQLALLDDRLDCAIYFVLGNHDFYHSSIAQVREDGAQLVMAMAPAEHPARAAPACHAATMACHRAVSRSVAARNPGLPPDR